jgi:hypothetical protein
MGALLIFLSAVADWVTGPQISSLFLYLVYQPDNITCEATSWALSPTNNPAVQKLSVYDAIADLPIAIGNGTGLTGITSNSIVNLNLGQVYGAGTLAGKSSVTSNDFSGALNYGQLHGVPSQVTNVFTIASGAAESESAPLVSINFNAITNVITLAPNVTTNLNGMGLEAVYDTVSIQNGQAVLTARADAAGSLLVTNLFTLTPGLTMVADVQCYNSLANPNFNLDFGWITNTSSANAIDWGGHFYPGKNFLATVGGVNQVGNDSFGFGPTFSTRTRLAVQVVATHSAGITYGLWICGGGMTQNGYPVGGPWFQTALVSNAPPSVMTVRANFFRYNSALNVNEVAVNSIGIYSNYFFGNSALVVNQTQSGQNLKVHVPSILILTNHLALITRQRGTNDTSSDVAVDAYLCDLQSGAILSSGPVWHPTSPYPTNINNGSVSFLNGAPVAIINCTTNGAGVNVMDFLAYAPLTVSGNSVAAGALNFFNITNLPTPPLELMSFAHIRKLNDGTQVLPLTISQSGSAIGDGIIWTKNGSDWCLATNLQPDVANETTCIQESDGNLGLFVRGGPPHYLRLTNLTSFSAPIALPDLTCRNSRLTAFKSPDGKTWIIGADGNARTNLAVYAYGDNGTFLSKRRLITQADGNDYRCFYPDGVYYQGNIVSVFASFGVGKGGATHIDYASFPYEARIQNNSDAQ